MLFSDVLKVSLTVLASIGTGGIIICALSAWLGKVWANRLMQKEIHEYNKELEDVKAKYGENLSKLNTLLEKKNYVSKVRFDAEFAIYRELCGIFFVLIKKVFMLFPTRDYISNNLTEETEKIQNERFEASRVALVEARDSLGKCSPFISEAMFIEFENLLDVCLDLHDYFPDFIIGTIESEKLRECRTNSVELKNKYKELSKKIRQYIQRLEVIE